MQYSSEFELGDGQSYHRLASPTQTEDDARKQLTSREIWGSTPRYGYAPKVQAYVGRLPLGEEGIEFWTDIPPDFGSPPGLVAWSRPRQGVCVEGEYAKISVQEISISYRSWALLLLNNS